MKIDLDKVEVHDNVWHDRYGWGSVVRTDNDTCDVLFSEATKALTFTEGGHANGKKVLWWQPPMLYTPRKGRDYSKLLEIVPRLIEWKFDD